MSDVTMRHGNYPCAKAPLGTHQPMHALKEGVDGDWQLMIVRTDKERVDGPLEVWIAICRWCGVLYAHELSREES